MGFKNTIGYGRLDYVGILFTLHTVVVVVVGFP